MTSRGIGLIGLGRHGQRYAHHLLHDVPGARLVAMSRRRRSEGERFAAEQGVRFFEDFFFVRFELLKFFLPFLQQGVVNSTGNV